MQGSVGSFFQEKLKGIARASSNKRISANGAIGREENAAPGITTEQEATNVTSSSLLVTSALLVVTRTLRT